MRNVTELWVEDADFDLKQFIPARLSALARLSQGLLASALGQCDMTIAHWRVYLCLAKCGPSTLNQIVAFTKLPQSSLSRSIARMSERGMVSNARNEHDRRYALIEITDEGRKQLAEAIRIVTATCDRALALRPDQEESFLSTLNDLIWRLSDGKE